MFLGLIGAVVVALLVKAWSPVVTGAMVAFVGVLFWIFPFATPETVRGVGVRAASQTVRGVAVLVMGLGALIAMGVLK